MYGNPGTIWQFDRKQISLHTDNKVVLYCIEIPAQYALKPHTVCMETPIQYVWKPQHSMYGNPWHHDTVQWNHIFQNAGQWGKTVKHSERSNSMLFHCLTEWLSAVADTVFVINTPSQSLHLYIHIWTHMYGAAGECSSPRSTFCADSYFGIHPRVTAVACKRSRSFRQKCRWQATAKHTYTLPMWLWIKWHCKLMHGWMVYTEPAQRRQQFHVASAMQQPKSAIGTPLPVVDIKNMRYKRIRWVCSRAENSAT